LGYLVEGIKNGMLIKAWDVLNLLPQNPNDRLGWKEQGCLL